jgi:DNA-binding transcriptional LysR family regulator
MSFSVAQVEAFRAVARHGGFGRAAEALGMTQPALSRAVARLEREVGFPLFRRGPGAARLTAEGATLLQEVERAFAGLDGLRQVAEDIRIAGTGRLRVACNIGSSLGLVPRAARVLLARYPDASLSIQARPSSQVYDWVASGQSDLGIATPRAGRGGVEDTLLISLPGCVALPRGHRLGSRRGPLSPQDLATENLLMLASEDASRQTTEAAFTTAGIRPRVACEAQNASVLCAMVAQGVGVAVVNPLVVGDLPGLPIVTRRFLPDIPFELRLLQPHGREESRLAEAFAEALRADVAEITAGNFRSVLKQG